MRELENVVSRAILRATARVPPGEPVQVELSDLSDSFHAEETAAPEPVAASTPVPLQTLREAVQDFQRRRIQQALEAAEGSWAAAARALGMDRSNLYHLARRLGLRT